jgi:hypothetical protein
VKVVRASAQGDVLLVVLLLLLLQERMSPLVRLVLLPLSEDGRCCCLA